METLFAKLNALGDVENVIVADLLYINSLSDPESYVQTFLDANGDSAKRYNYAVIDGKFDPENDAFVDPRPYASWQLDTKFLWQAPTPKPEGNYVWNEPTLSWQEVT
jgi:hypothetical protein